jgi:O-glycosyl hydrolase
MAMLSVISLSGCEVRVSDEFEKPRDLVFALNIDTDKKYQVIEGFGGFGGKAVWWKEGPYYDEAFIQLLVEDLGLSILRDNIPLSFEPENDNDDPTIINFERFNLTKRTKGSEGALNDHFAYLKALHQAGLNKLIVSVWSPPLWMKHNQHPGNGSLRDNSAPPYNSQPNQTSNQLKKDLYLEFAEYCVAYIRLLKIHTGIDLYAISLQNEPRFSQFYASTVYSPQSLVELIKVVGSHFASEGIKTKIFAPEDVYNIKEIRKYLQAILKDPVANQYTDIFAIHNYANDGIQPKDGGPSNWRETYELAVSGGKQVWMTETSGFSSESIEDGLSLAKSMFSALKYGNVSAWIYWQMAAKDSGDLIHQGRPTILYYISKHFYRHIRPGDVRVEVGVADDSLLSLGFNGVSGLKIIIINTVNSPRTVRLNLLEIGTIYQTTAIQWHKKLDNVDLGEGFSVPGFSITTILVN